MEKKEDKEKIEKKQEEHIKEKSRLKYFLIIGFILVIGFIAIITITEKEIEEIIPDRFIYNDISFAKVENNLWSFGIKYNEQEIGIKVHNTPLHLKDIEVIGNLQNFLPSNNTYLSYNPKSWDNDQSLKIALGDFVVKLAGLGVIIQNETFFESNNMIVCSEHNDNICNSIGVFNCDDEDEKVIMFIENDYTYIKAEENCIKIYAKKGDFVRGTDRILYSWFNIMD